jgi:hypothetical protein
MGKKWAQNLSGSTAYITAGVNRVTTAPGLSAAAAQDRMLANLTASVTSGQWAKRVAGVSLAQWQTAMNTKGVGRVATGAQAAITANPNLFGPLLTAVDASVATLANTPRGNLQQNIQRAVQFMTAMSANAPKRQA